jgi:hypothetical protein
MEPARATCSLERESYPMTKKYQVEIITPSARLRTFSPVFDPFEEEDKPKYDKLVNGVNAMGDGWEARMVEVEEESTQN